MTAIPGPRQAAKLAVEYHELDREIGKLRTRLNGLVKQQEEREISLLAYAKAHGEGKIGAVTLVAGRVRFHLAVAQKRCSPSYKNELLRFIDAADIQKILDSQPTKDELQFSAFPK
jgi:hypothetical protein